jgi:polyisoprenoid-binding protein YceI
VTNVRYLIDGKGSKFIVKASATGLFSAFGHSPTIAIADFEGEAQVNPGAMEQSSLHLVIHTASLSVIDDISEKDRKEIERKMYDEVLETDGYPDIVYECSKVSASKITEEQYRVVLNGELSLHGVMRDEPVSAQVTIRNESLRAIGEFSVRLSDYEIKPVSAAGGTVKLKDELKFSFDITARKQT